MLLYTNYLNKKVLNNNSNIKIYSLHPGMCKTGLLDKSKLPFFFKTIVRCFSRSIDFPCEFIIKCIGNEKIKCGDFYGINAMSNNIEKIELSKTTFSIINKYLINIEKRESSIINKLFMSCILYNYVNIKTQKREFYKIEHGNTIELTIPNTKNITLDMCFLETFKEDTMIDDNAWYDENTKTKKGVIKKTFICYFPEILVIQLKRWNTNLYKNSSLVISPFIFDLQPYTIYEKNNNCKYELFGIINHHGSVKGGHYYIYIKKNGWFVIDDETIQKIDKGLKYGLSASYFSLLLLNKKKNDS